MEQSDLTARQMFVRLRDNPGRRPYGFGRRPMLINVDLQKAYTLVGAFPTAYENDPHQMDYVNQLAALARGRGLPVIWTYVAFNAAGDDCGVFGSRSDTPDSLQNIKLGSPRAEFDDRLVVLPDSDIVLNKKMPSAFHETHLQSLATWHGIDTVIVTGGSTSGCVRATGSTSAYFFIMSYRLAKCGLSCRSATHSSGTMVR